MDSEKLARIKEMPDYQRITLLKKVHEYEDVYTFIFKPEKKVEFIPGYYAHFLLEDLPEEAGKAVRDLSIASCTTDDEVWFSMHVRESSPFKKHLDAVKEGEQVSIFKIKGEFVLPEDIKKPIVLLAAGIGITPFRAMLREESEKGSDRDMTLVHVSSGEYLYEEDLKDNPATQIRITPEETKDTLSNLRNEKQDACFYVSGPPKFVDDIKELLDSLGVVEDNIKQDWFDGYEDLAH